MPFPAPVLELEPFEPVFLRLSFEPDLFPELFELSFGPELFPELFELVLARFSPPVPVPVLGRFESCEFEPFEPDFSELLEPTLALFAVFGSFEPEAFDLLGLVFSVDWLVLFGPDDSALSWYL